MTSRVLTIGGVAAAALLLATLVWGRSPVCRRSSPSRNCRSTRPAATRRSRIARPPVRSWTRNHGRPACATARGACANALLRVPSFQRWAATSFAYADERTRWPGVSPGSQPAPARTLRLDAAPAVNLRSGGPAPQHIRSEREGPGHRRCPTRSQAARISRLDNQSPADANWRAGIRPASRCAPPMAEHGGTKRSLPSKARGAES